MCNRAMVLLLLACAAAAPGRAGAQETAVWRARLEQLAARADSLDAVRRQRDSARAVQDAMESFTVGGLHGASPAELAPRVQAAAGAAMPRLRARFGTAIDRPATEGILVRPVRGDAPPPARSGWLEVLRDPQAQAPPVSSEVFPATATDERLRDGIEQVLSQMAWQEVGSSFRQWLDPSVAARGLAYVSWPAIYVELVVSPSHLTRLCLQGDPERCTQALGFLSPGQHPAFVWYDEAERLRLGRRAFPPGGSSPGAQCASAGIPASCDAAWRSADWAQVPPPLGIAARSGLVQIALQAGGEGAFTRLNMASRTVAPREALIAAAGIPLDSLAHLWLARVRASRPAPAESARRGTLLAACWASLLGVLALRSSRWR